jgi:hypothetical protein
MASIGKIGLLALFVAVWSATALAQNTTNKTNNANSNTAAPTNTRTNTNTPAQRINNIVNYNTVKTNQNPGPTSRITASGTQPMTPNAPSQSGRGLHTNPVPSPSSANQNACYNTQGRNVNPTGDKRVAAGFTANQNRYQTSQSKPTTTTAASTTRSWPGPTRPATAVIHPSTATPSTPVRPVVTAAVRSAAPPSPPRNSATTTGTSTTKSTTNKKP